MERQQMTLFQANTIKLRSLRKLFLKTATMGSKFIDRIIVFFLPVARMWSILNIVVALVKSFPEQSSSAPPADQEAQVVVLFFCFVFLLNLKQNKKN